MTRTGEAEQLFDRLRKRPESEILEFKEAKQSFKTSEIGRYFSALSNEANLKGVGSAWLLFGVCDDGSICGTSFRQEASTSSKGLQKLKKEIADSANNRITFKDIFELRVEERRVIAFQIPAATRGIPTLWAGAAYAREAESIVPLPMNKIDEIRRQPPFDWSKKTIPGTDLALLDKAAVARARQKLEEQYGERSALVDTLEDAELLDKMGLTLHGKVTNTALLLLGSEDTLPYFESAVPKITWSLYDADGSVRTYEHFTPPLLLRVDDVLAKIRNEKYRLLVNPRSAVPREITEYDPWSLRELVGNAIAHQAYDRGGKINVEEFEDEIVVMNEGGFIPGSIENALSIGYKPPFYRNPFLCEAMLRLGMLDQNSMGIRTVYLNAKSRCMPLPTYDLDDPMRVKVRLFGREINQAYTHILFENEDLPLQTVFELDKAQKGLPLSGSEESCLEREGYVRVDESGNVTLEDPSFDSDKGLPPDAEGHPITPTSSYRRAKKDIEATVLSLLSEGSLSRNDLIDQLRKYPSSQSYFADHGAGRRMYSLLKEMEGQGKVSREGNTRSSRWHLAGTGQ